jgi:hypothetical protein
MSDDPVRHARSFEPPPWERERFEELARRRAEREAAEAVALRARDDAAREAAARAATDEAEEAAAAAEPRTGGDAEEPAHALPGGRRAAAGHGSAVPEADVLLMGLAAEEPRAFAHAWVAWIVAAGLFAALGLGTVVFGSAGLARAQGSSIATAWSFVLVVAGLASLGAAVWLTVRALKERGA